MDAALAELLEVVAKLPPVGPWVSDAACRGRSEVFTAYPSTLTARETIDRTCRACPVRAECLRYADGHDVDGVWAGEWRNTKPKWTGRQAAAPAADEG